MGDYFLSERIRLRRILDLESRRDRFKGVKRTTKINILSILILVLAAGLFFSIFSGHFARANEASSAKKTNLKLVDPMSRINDLKEGKDKKNEIKVCLEDKNPKSAVVVLDNKTDNSCEKQIGDIVGNHPIEKMIPYICNQDKNTAAFLVAIARKESSWGDHAPSLNGRDCYNYWGYKGSHNLVQGYSCFDSPEQAVEEVGGRIGRLIEKKIDTPEKMVVWKCGGGCARDSGAGSWIGAVRQYWTGLVS